MTVQGYHMYLCLWCLRIIPGLLLQTTLRVLFFSVAVFEYCVLVLMTFLLSALIGASSRVRTAFPGVDDFISEGMLFPDPFCIFEFVDAVAVFQKFILCSFESSAAFLAYRWSRKIDWVDARCVRWVPPKEKTGNMKRIPEEHMRGKKLDQNGIRVTEILSQLDVISRSYGRIKLNDAQEQAWLASIEDKGGVEDSHTVDSNENQEEPAEKMASNFHGLLRSGRRGTSSLQTIRNPYAK